MHNLYSLKLPSCLRLDLKYLNKNIQNIKKAYQNNTYADATNWRRQSFRLFFVYTKSYCGERQIVGV